MRNTRSPRGTGSGPSRLAKLPGSTRMSRIREHLELQFLLEKGNDLPCLLGRPVHLRMEEPDRQTWHLIFRKYALELTGDEGIGGGRHQKDTDSCSAQQ